jgi:hypothetical protein
LDGARQDDSASSLADSAAVSPDSRPVVVFYTSAGNHTWYAPGNGWPIDWSTDQPATPTDPHVYRDISGDGKCDVLYGFSDWAQTTPAPGVTKLSHMSPAFQCHTGPWAD